jgi:hypothetical protein
VNDIVRIVIKRRNKFYYYTIVTAKIESHWDNYDEEYYETIEYYYVFKSEQKYTQKYIKHQLEEGQQVIHTKYEEREAKLKAEGKQSMMYCISGFVAPEYESVYKDDSAPYLVNCVLYSNLDFKYLKSKFKEVKL